MIDLERRNALKTSCGLGLFGILVAVGVARPGIAWAERNKQAFDAKTVNEAFDALGVVAAVNGAAIQLTAPEIAENGAVVPITVSSSLARIEQIAILVDKNPSMLAAQFFLPEGTEGFVTTRIKMAQTSSVIVLVKANGKFYRASQEVKVTVGGC